jgi:transmembrane sensor
MSGITDYDRVADRIRDEAAGWIVRLEGRETPRLRRKFEQWLAADPRHPGAYRRLTEQFDGAKILRGSQLYTMPLERPRRTVRNTIAASALAAAFATLLILWAGIAPLWRDAGTHHAPVTVASSDRIGAVHARRLIAPVAALGTVGLEDGSVVTLDAGSVIDVAFAVGARRITLQRGRVRFEVAHDRRPFTVYAGGGSVTARGTIFDVSIGRHGEVAVALLRGVVDVVPAIRRHSIVGPAPLRRLVAGESAGYLDGALRAGSSAVPLDEPQWIAGAVDFDNVSLGYLLDRGNQSAGTRIKVTDPLLKQLRVSGRFELADHHRLARNLAALYDLHVDSSDDAIVLSR